MNLFAIPVALTKKILRVPVRIARVLIRPLRADTSRLLFVFGGRTSYWAGMGRTLYEQEPIFRASVQETCQLVYQLAGENIKPNFEGPLDENFFADSNKVIFGIMTIQLALADLWNEKGIVPDATMGVSLGEAAAVYAAGGLTRTDVVRICTTWHKVGLTKNKEFISIYIQASLADAQALCRDSPVFLSVVYEAGPGSVLAFYRRPDKPLVRAFLDEQQVVWQQVYPDTSWPFHTPLFAPDRRAIEHNLKDLSPQPLQRDYYSPTLGKRLPAHTLVPAWLWPELICSPVLLYTTFNALLADRYRVIMQVCPHPFLVTGTQKNAFDPSKAFLLLDSMRYQTPELPLFRQTYRKLRLLTWRSVLGRQLKRQPTTDEYSRFVEQLNLASPEVARGAPDLYDYLRRRGSVHYLPVYQGWLVCNHAEVNHVLQHPELFSSEINKGFDAFLVGIDPPNHTVIRALMMPLFAPQVLGDLGKYTQRELTDRLQKLASLPQFDVVEELAIPLVQSVMAHFLDLSSQADHDLRASLKTHLYSLAYMDDLIAFFRTYLEQSSPGRVGQLLMKYVQAGQLPLEGAASIMRTFWIAGTLTTSMLLTNLINALVRQPHLAKRLRSSPDLIPKFVEEGLRLEPSETTLWRTTTQVTTLGGQQLPARSLVLPSLLSANRDPQVFNNPNEYDLDRPARRVMTFGGGVHQCIGAGIARSQAQIMVQVVLTTLPNLRLAQPGPPQYYTPTSQRALINLWACA